MMNWSVQDLVKVITRLDKEQKAELAELKQLIRELKIELVLKNKNDEYGNDNND
jgi:hypothetical protein